MSSMSSGHGPAKVPHLLYIGEGPPKNPRHRRRQGTLILPCSGHVRPTSQAPCNVAILTNTTLSNGYLGSRIDEECSKMRYHGVNCIIPQTIEFLNASCTRGLLVEGTSAWASRKKTLPTHQLGTDVVFGSPCLVVRWAEVGAAGVSCRAPACGGRHKLFSV